MTKYRRKSALNKTTILITMGDPAGIGPEIIVKSFLQEPKLFKILQPIVVGDLKVLKKYLRDCRSMSLRGSPSLTLRTGSATEAISLFNEIATHPSAPDLVGGRNDNEKVLYVIDLKNVNLAKLQIGKVHPAAGKASIEYINFAIEILKKLNYKIPLVTAPVSKKAIIKSGIDFSGHTEYLSKLTKGGDTGEDTTDEVAMVMVSENYKVLLLTRHIPLKDVSKKLSKEYIIKQVKIAIESLKRYFDIRISKVLMCNLNPHSGEGGGGEGVFGLEEKNVIIPAIRSLRRSGLNIVGPLPTEVAFAHQKPRTENQKLIVSNYHDQGMLPLKLLCGRKFVNLTCGLPFVRTSPAHGPAFDIAGKNIADPTSMIEALKLAALAKIK